MKKLLGLALMAMVAWGIAGGSAWAQGGRGGMGGGMMSSRLMVMLRGGEALQKELDFSDEQVAKLGDLMEELREARGDQDAMKDIEKDALGMLDEKQQTRLTEIYVQVAGMAALTDETVAKKVGLSADEQAKVKELIDANRSEMQELFQEMRDGGDREAMREKMTEMGEKLNKSLEELLSDEQLKKFEELKGEKFEMPQGRGGRGGAGGGGAGGGRGGRGGNGGGGNGGGARSDF